VHVPFCAHVCPYCDFAVSRGDEAAADEWLDGLRIEVSAWSGSTASFDTVYLGGGTPSWLGPSRLATLLDLLRGELALAPDVWVTLEANPEDVHEGRLRAWRSLGVNAVSLGVQSFAASRLRFLGRGHDPAIAEQSVSRCLDAGFEWVSLDLIYGLPMAVAGEPADSLADVAAAVALGPHHVSAYQLGIETGTAFGRRRSRGELAELATDLQAEVFMEVHSALAAAGYAAYEVSSFARSPRHRSRHNRRYWSHRPYLGLGPAAHSFSGSRRWWNEPDWRQWRRRLAAGQSPVAGEESLGDEQLALETILLSLRQPAGLDLARFRERFAVDLEAANRELFAAWLGDGLVTRDRSRIRPTPSGLAVAEALAAAVELPPVPGEAAAQGLGIGDRR
jgi:oxygen-independent coproporphyrinogen-3 oxidase